MELIKIAIAGVGNCASALIQGVEFYRNHSNNYKELIGTVHPKIGDYGPGDIEIVAAFDIDARKVGFSLNRAIFASPNCCQPLFKIRSYKNIIVQMAPILDGVSEHMLEFPENQTFVIAEQKPVDIEKILKESKAEILVNFLPVGSEEASKYYAECCLKSGVSLINCIPVFIVSNKVWADRFRAAGIPVVGDDIKSQLGATILHRSLVRLFLQRGITIDRSYQLNIGGNTDFLNMLNRKRLVSKKHSKTEAISSLLPDRFDHYNLHVGPSDYVPWQRDNKIAFIRIEGRGFANFPINLELRLSVEDSPNSGGCVIDAIRCVKLARNRGVSGPLTSISAYTMKHPPEYLNDEDARRRLEEFILGNRER